MLNNEAQAATCTAILTAAARTSNASSAYIDVRDWEGDIAVILCVGSVTGTSPTLDVNVDTNATGSGGGTAVSGGAFTQVTATNNTQKLTIPAGETQGYIRVTAAYGGTTPSFTFSVVAMGRRKIV